MNGPQDSGKAMPPIAVVGMSGRFPGASTLDTFWQVIAEGRDTISRFTAEDLAADEPNLAEVQAAGDNYVRARGILQGVENFDAGFFGFSPAEAAMLDPQQRLWLEVAWEALEVAGYGHGHYDGAVGVFAGGFSNNYLLNNLLSDRRAIEEYVRMRKSTSFAQMLANDNAFLASRTAYKFDLRGPAINVQTACSTSLVAVAMAVQSLLTYESDVCLVGGVCVSVPQRTGYFYQEGAIFSRDGYCRPYDKDACGTVFSNGAGAVVLRRLDEALEAGDRVLAVIRGAALNNDGHHKVSYTAPSVEGQAEVIATAQAMAGIDPRTIGYVEGHGTATPMGDPIEVAALTRAFGLGEEDRGFCALGSLKANIGHLDAAAGIAGVIKAVLMLQHRYLPPTAHFSAPNPDLHLERTPFFVPQKGQAWEATPRRAGVSSFGIGGTNAHVILEEPPELEARESEKASPPRVVLLSAESEQALSGVSERLLHHIQNDVAASGAAAPRLFDDYVYTLASRRKAFRYRRVVVARDFSELQSALASPSSTGHAPASAAKWVAMFPGQGSMQAGVAAPLLKHDPVFADFLQRGAKLASEKLQFPLWEWFQDADANLDDVLHDNARLQLSILVLEIALHEALKAAGVTPDVVMGHSLGEWTALYAASVLSLSDVIEAVYHRGRLMQTMPAGGAIAVRLSAQEADAYESDEISVAAVNGVKACLLSGQDEALVRLAKRLSADGVQHRALPIHVAVHSPLVDPLIEPFAQVLRGLRFSRPTLPVLCTATGTFLPEDSVVDPEFWARQMRVAVNFAGALQRTEELGASVLVEVGPGQALSGLARPQLPSRRQQRALALLDDDAPAAIAEHGLLPLLGRMWAHGVAVDMTSHLPQDGRVAELPTYPFQRSRHWLEAPHVTPARDRATDRPSARPESVRPLSGPPSKSHAPSVAPMPANTDAQVQRLLLEMSGLSPADIELDTPFADTGLDSLFLAQFAEEISSRFAIRVGFRELAVEHNTINKLARFLDSRGANVRRSEVPRKAFVADAAFSGLVVLRSGSADRPPLIFIHGDRANDFLLAYLPADQPVFGYLHQCDSGERIQYDTVEKLAQRCVEEIKLAFPEGPVIMGGHSYGGTIAYHATHLLRQEGREVLQLLLMDAYHPSVLKRGNSRLRHPLRGPVIRARERVRHALNIARAEVYLDRGEPVPPELRNAYVLSTYDRACEAYVPPPTDVPTTLFLVSEAIYDLPGYGWPGVVRNLEIVSVEGDHLSIVRSAQTFEPLGLCIAEALQKLSPSRESIAP